MIDPLAPRFNSAAVSLNGTTVQPKCDGGVILTYQQAGQRITGTSKSPVIKSDGQLQTPYWAVWINQNDPPVATWQSSGINCNRVIGNEGKPWFNPIYQSEHVKATRSWPCCTAYFPLHTMSIGKDGVINTVPTTNGYFEDIKQMMHTPFLNKIKDQKAMALVTLAETQKTVGLAKSLFSDITETLLTITRGILNPKSLVTKYRGYAVRNGLRPVPKKALKSYSVDERKFIQRMQKYYKKHPNEHNKLLKEGIPRTAAERWLQYRYGIGPALGDLAAMHDYCYTKWHEFVHTNDIVVKYREGTTRAVSSSADGIGFANVRGTSTIKAQFISRFYVGNHTAMVARKTGFSPAELLAAAWELVPWSFVADWFWDLGSYFSAASAVAGLRHRRTSFSVKESVTASIEVVGSMFMQVTKPSTTQGGQHLEYGAFVRKIYNDFPFPSVPPLTLPFTSLTSKRAFDTLALLFGKRDFTHLSNR